MVSYKEILDNANKVITESERFLREFPIVSHHCKDIEVATGGGGYRLEWENKRIMVLEFRDGVKKPLIEWDLETRLNLLELIPDFLKGCVERERNTRNFEKINESITKVWDVINTYEK